MNIANVPIDLRLQLSHSGEGQLNQIGSRSVHDRTCFLIKLSTIIRVYPFYTSFIALSCINKHEWLSKKLFSNVYHGEISGVHESLG